MDQIPTYPRRESRYRAGGSGRCRTASSDRSVRANSGATASITEVSASHACAGVSAASAISATFARVKNHGVQAITGSPNSCASSRAVTASGSTLPPCPFTISHRANFRPGQPRPFHLDAHGALPVLRQRWSHKARAPSSRHGNNRRARTFTQAPGSDVPERVAPGPSEHHEQQHALPQPAGQPDCGCADHEAFGEGPHVVVWLYPDGSREERHER
jgi:hypothetical protein